MPPSWDLFIIAFIATLTAYAFIIGKNQTLKMILATYLAALASDGAGNLFAKYILNAPELSQIANIEDFSRGTIVFKIIAFVLILIFISINSGITITSDEHESRFIGLTATVILGFLSATLILATLVTYSTGGGFLFSTVVNGGLLANAVKDSNLLNFFVEHGSIAFLLPAFVFIFASISSK